MGKIQYNNNQFIYYASAKYTGTSILTNKKWQPGEPIYWCKLVGGFTYQEAKQFNLITNNNIQNINNFHSGSTDSNITYDDSISRELAKQLFKKEFNIQLIDHTGLYQKDNDIFHLQKNGKYCEDLKYWDKESGKTIYVEVERSKKQYLFDEQDHRPITILVSKYWKYFHDGNPLHMHYMCFINEELQKACLILGSDIMNTTKNYVPLNIENKIKEVYEIPKKLGKIYSIK